MYTKRIQTTKHIFLVRKHYSPTRKNRRGNSPRSQPISSEKHAKCDAKKQHETHPKSRDRKRKKAGKTRSGNVRK